MTKDNDIIIGTIVTLKSGSPNMTVSGFLTKTDGDNFKKGVGASLLKRNEDENNPYVICEWFDGTSNTRAVFNKEMLNIVK